MDISEIWHYIMIYVNIGDIKSISLINKRIYATINNIYFWEEYLKANNLPVLDRPQPNIIKNWLMIYHKTVNANKKRMFILNEMYYYPMYWKNKFQIDFETYVNKSSIPKNLYSIGIYNEIQLAMNKLYQLYHCLTHFIIIDIKTMKIDYEIMKTFEYEDIYNDIIKINFILEEDLNLHIIKLMYNYDINYFWDCTHSIIFYKK